MDGGLCVSVCALRRNGIEYSYNARKCNHYLMSLIRVALSVNAFKVTYYACDDSTEINFT